MTPVNISISDVIYVDFPTKTVLVEIKLPFEKLDLVREGLINYKRLIRRGQVQLISDNYGNTVTGAEAHHDDSAGVTGFKGGR